MVKHVSDRHGEEIISGCTAALTPWHARGRAAAIRPINHVDPVTREIEQKRSIRVSSKCLALGDRSLRPSKRISLGIERPGATIIRRIYSRQKISRLRGPLEHRLGLRQ